MGLVAFNANGTVDVFNGAIASSRKISEKLKNWVIAAVLRLLVKMEDTVRSLRRLPSDRCGMGFHGTQTPAALFPTLVFTDALTNGGAYRNHLWQLEGPKAKPA